MRRIILFITVLIIIARPISIVVQQKDLFFSKGYMKNYENLHFAYDNSQYVKKDKPGIILDETLESFAAGAFLKGLNPILIVHDQPPLGRYITALSILIFDNARTITLPLVFLSGLGFFLISRLVLKNAFVSLVPCAIFFNEPRFLSTLKYSPLLETIQLPFIIFALYFFMRALLVKEQYTKWFILTSLMIGFVISIRFFIVGLVLISAMGFYFILKRQKRRLLFFASSLSLSVVVLVLSYTKMIQEGYSLLHVFGVQKYILFYHQSKFILPFSFWDLFIFNRWHTWWGDKSISYDPQWLITWPVSMVLTLVYACLALMKKIRLEKGELVLLLWAIFYSLSLSAGYTSTRYFLPLIPFLYILATSFVIKLKRRG